MRANCWLMALALTAAVAMPARAGQTTPGSGMIFVADSKDAVGNNPDFDTEYPYPHVSTRAGDAMLGVGYGVVNWNAGYCTAGQQARLAKWNDPNDDYEKLGTWEGGGSWTDITYAGRGLVRYDEDTYLVLCTQSNPENTNAASVPAVLQVEYYDDWFTSPPYTDDQYLDSVNYDSVYLLRAAPRPDAAQWGPQPQDTFLTPPGPCDWSWTGCGTVGKLQFADTATIGPSYAWDDDPNANPMYDYITFCSLGQNFQSVDNAWGPFRHDGDLYKDSRDVSGRASEDFADSSALELVAFYGETENVLYMTQYAGRIYKMVGAKNLGWRRRAGQAAPDTRLGDGTNITQTPNYFFPLYVGGSLYAADTSGGGPVIGDAILADPNDPNGPYVGTAMTSVELFNAALPYDPNDPNTLDPVVTDRHYTGLAVDCGGRVYAVSERIVNGNGDEPAAKFRGVQADVWNYAPGEYGLYRIEKASNLFGDPNTTPVAVGDTLVLTEGSVDPSFLNVEFTIEAIDPGGVFAKLDGDCGDSEGAFNVSYTVYSPGASPIPDPNTNPFTSQALIDVYLPDGTLDTIIDLNTLVRPDGVSLGDYRYDGGNIHGVIIHGDVEIDPGLVYDPNDPNWPLDPLGEDVTRLWIYCAGGDEDPSTDDGLDLVVVDVSIAANGTVAGASFVGGIDDGDIDIGMFHQGDYTRGFNPWDKWIAFSELEFDGASNLVAIGGRGMDGNRYAGVTAASVKEAVARMLGEAAGDPNDPNNDAIVGINGFNMDMDIYGFKTAYGFAFADSPLWNNGSKTVPPPTVEFDAVSSSGDESVTPVNLSVSLSAASDQTVTVDYAVTGGTAVDPNDYAIAAGPLTFDPGVTQQDIVITVVDDGLVESDETIEVTLSDPSNAILGTNTVHTYTINDNDVYPTVAFDLVSSSGDESVTPVNLSVSLSAAYVETVTVDYAVTGGTAVDPNDYTIAAGPLTFDPGVTQQDIVITVVDDGEAESDETIEVTLSNPSNATLGTNTVHTYTITDNEPPTLIDSEPQADSSLPKTQNNLLLCVFDKPITLPVGNPLVIQDMSDPNVPCNDVSNLFTYTIDADDPNGCTLQAKENGAQLTNLRWYQVNSALGWTTVEPFQFEVYTLIGDCEGGGRVSTLDYTCVKGAIGQRGDVREDLDGGGRVTTGDYLVVKNNLGPRKPPKPALCPAP